MFYEEGGKFKVASVVQKNDSSYQVNTQHGKRIKLKESHVFLTFEQDMDVFLTKVNEKAEEIDVDFLWEVAEDEFTLEQLGQDYFGVPSMSAEQVAALLICLYNAPIYFYKKSKGLFKAAPEEALNAAKASIERKEKEQKQKQVWIDQLIAGKTPDELSQEIMAILHTPNKQNLLHQAFLEAAESLKTNPLNLARSLGLIRSMADYLLGGFELKCFPKGIQFPDLPIPERIELSRSSARAFSIDDDSTTEIDDALSVEFLENGHVKVGVHIAVPAAFVEKDSPIEKMIFERMSTVYYPGDKITMLPKTWCDAFSLVEGSFKPVLSLYFEVDQELNIVSSQTILEEVQVEKNLRIQSLEPKFNKKTLPTLVQTPETIPYQNELLYLHQLAQKLYQQRGQENTDNQPARYDYSINLVDGKVEIKQRVRGEPIDFIVGEMMIYANSYWAGELKNHHLPAIFRTQTTGKVRFATEAAEHVSMGVAQYAWCTSPLRRGCDFANQKQLLSLYADYPVLFESKDAQVFAVLRAFETAYASYAQFQQEMEFYYTLCYLQQESITEFEGVFLKEGLIRASNLPLVLHVMDTPESWQGKHYLFSVKHIDLWAQTASIQLEKELNTVVES